MLRRSLILGLPALMLSACSGLPALPRRPRRRSGVTLARGLSLPPRTTLLVAAPAEVEGSGLGEAGRARAQALVTAAEEFNLSAVYSPAVQSNVETAVPVAEARGLRLEPVEERAAGDQIIEGAAGRQTLWVAGPRAVHDFWTALSLPDDARPSAPGDLAIIRSDGQGNVTIEPRRYGAG